MKKFILGIMSGALIFAGVFFFFQNRTSVDQQFLKAVGNGLEARWDYQENNDYNPINDNQEILLESAKAELSTISKFANKTFEDETLQGLAYSYINAVSNQVSALESSRFDIGLFNGSIFDRLELVSQLDAQYGLSVSEKNADKLEAMVNQGNIVAKAKAVLSHSTIVSAGLTLSDLYQQFTGSNIGDDLSSFLHFLDKDLSMPDYNLNDFAGDISGWVSGVIDKASSKFSFNF